MEEEIKYLENKIEDLEAKVRKAMDYGYSGDIVDDALDEIVILQNILDKIN